MTKAPKERLTGAGRVAFLARLDKFRDLLEAGWPITVVYETYGGADTGLSYSQFVRYVGKYIRTPSKRGSEQVKPLDQSPTPTTPSPALSRLHPGPTPLQAPTSRSGFQHDPNSGNERDDLI
ncbi:TraK oriT-binding protein [Burkholderia multivorans]|jgi:hypothetical protein|nr:TraK oriT-binding protein [Burkholderia multivorans]